MGAGRHPAWFAVLAVASACGGALAACGSPAGAPPATAESSPLWRASGELRCGLTVKPASPAAMRPCRLTIVLRDAGGRTWRGPVPGVSLVMPGMEMPPREPALAASGRGRFSADVLLPMSGPWTIEIRATEDGAEHVFSFPLRVR